MVPTKEAGKEPTEHPEGQPIVASAKTLYSKTNTKLPRQRRGPDVPHITAELTNTLSTHSNPHTIAGANSAAITIRCMASEIREGEAQGWNDMQHLQHSGMLELPSRQHSMPGRPTRAAKIHGSEHIQHCGANKGGSQGND